MSDYQIPVKIRVDVCTEASPLMSVPFGTNLGSVIRLVGSWGVATDYGEYDEDSLVGQFTVADGDAFFEIIVITEGD